jgi:hypothetical protein
MTIKTRKTVLGDIQIECGIFGGGGLQRDTWGRGV